jgi:hypothetical protein
MTTIHAISSRHIPFTPVHAFSLEVTIHLFLLLPIHPSKLHTMKLFMSLLLLSQASLASAKVLSINEGNFLEKTEGRAVFLKFYEPG